MASRNEGEETDASRYDSVEVPAVEANTSTSEGTATSPKDFRTKYYTHPWLRIGASPRPPCTDNEHSCEEHHGGEGEVRATELSMHFNYVICEMIKDGFTLEAFQHYFLHVMRTDYPGVEPVQKILQVIIDTDSLDVVAQAQLVLRSLLEIHPPCAYRRGAYYNKILLDSRTEDGQEISVGIFFDIISKLEGELNRTKEESSPKPSLSTEDCIEAELALPIFYEKVHTYNDLNITDRIKRLFIVFSFITDVMERDLVVFLVKYSVLIEKETCLDELSVLRNQETRPLIVNAIWKNEINQIGSVSIICERLIRLYLKGFQSDYATLVPFRTFHKLFALIVEVMNAQDKGLPNKDLLNYGQNCQTMAQKFLQLITLSNLDMSDLRYILKSLKPSWLSLYLSESEEMKNLFSKDGASLMDLRRGLRYQYEYMQRQCMSKDVQNGDEPAKSKAC